MIRKIVILNVFLFFFLPVYSNTKNDSLLKELQQAKADTSQINILNQLSKELNDIGEYERAMQYAIEAKDKGEKINYKKGLLSAYNTIGNIYANKSKYDKAIENYLSALKISEEIGNKKASARIAINIGSMYDNENNYEKALEYYFTALKISKEIGDKMIMVASYSNIGSSYDQLSKYEEALENHFASLKISQELGIIKGIIRSYNNIGLIYAHQGKYEKAIENYLASYNNADKIKDEKSIAICYNNMGEVYTKQNKFQEAEQMINKALVIFKKINDKENIKETHLSLSDLFTAQNFFEKAYRYYKLYSEEKDSLLNETITKQIAEMSAKYETEKKQKEIELLNKEKEKQIAITAEQNKRKNIIIWSVISGLIVVILFSLFLFNRFQVTRKQKNIISEKNKEITDSINYAKRIQEAILPMEETFQKTFPQSFILYKPKDIVSGDFYWLTEKNSKIIFTAVDCTGHGVPGAFMSLIGFSLLNQIIKEQNITTPSEILKELSKGINLNFKQNELSQVKDGMDITLCCYDKVKNILEYAGAFNPLYYFRNNQFHEIKSDKTAIGDFNENIKYTNHKIELQKGDSIYIFSDGYTDQFGGAEGKKFKNKKFQELLLSIQTNSMPEQKNILDNTINQWKGALEQTDDILVIGIKIS